MKRSGWKVIGKGQSGWHANGAVEVYSDDCRSTISSSTYDTSDTQLNKYVEESEDGALVYDASEADETAFVRFVVSGPMVKPELPNGTILKLFDKNPVAPDPSYEPGPIDYVSLDLYEQSLRRIPGVRVGHVHTRKLVWE